MPAPIAPLVAFSLGILFAWAAADGITRASGSLIVSRPFAVTLSFAAFVFLPVAGYFSFFATDWSIAYLFDTRHLPSAVLLLLALFDGACLLGGFAVGAFYVQRRQNVSLLPLMTVPLAVAAVIVAMLGHRLSVHGTYTQVRRGLGPATLGGPLR